MRQHLKRTTRTALSVTIVCALLCALLVWMMSAARVAARPGSQREPQPPPEIAEPPWPDLPEGVTIIEGDIMIGEQKLAAMRLLGPDAAWDTNLWPDGVVPYEFDGNVSAANRQKAIDAMAEWEAVATVDFVERDGEADYIHIQSSTMNSSFVGMIGGGQTVNIVSWDWRFIIAHELGHALGLWHEQSRPNRDDFVRIEVDCIIPDKVHNFDIHAGAGTYPPSFGYDFDSVMHYGETAFFTPTNQHCIDLGRTITVLEPYHATWQHAIGQRDHLSDFDQENMSFLYPESDWRFVNASFGGMETGTFPNPYDTLQEGALATPAGGTVWIMPGDVPAVGTYATAMTLRAPLGGVMLGDY